MRADSFPLQTRRLLLRPVRVGDASALLALYGDWGVARWLSRLPWPFTPESAEAMIAQAEEALRLGSACSLLMVERETTAVAGLVSLRLPARDAEPWTNDTGLGILGYSVSRSRWGEGFAGEGAACVTGYAFTELDLARLRATPLRGNTASRRVLERLGFSIARAGVEETALYGGPPRVGDVYMLEQRHWLAARQQPEQA